MSSDRGLRWRVRLGVSLGRNEPRGAGMVPAGGIPGGGGLLQAVCACDLRGAFEGGLPGGCCRSVRARCPCFAEAFPRAHARLAFAHPLAHRHDIAHSNLHAHVTMHNHDALARAQALACTDVCAHAMPAMHAHAQTLRMHTLHTQARHGSCGGDNEEGASNQEEDCASFAGGHLFGRQACMLACRHCGGWATRGNGDVPDVRHLAMRRCWMWTPGLPWPSLHPPYTPLT